MTDGTRRSGSLSHYLSVSQSLLTASQTYPGVARIDAAVDVIVDAFQSGAPLLVCGNGGSAADALHIAGELVGRFLKERRALDCICLNANPSVLTAWSNDYAFETVFARQVEAHGRRGGVLLGISTSGNSRNIVLAFEAARAAGLTTIGLTGEGGGAMAAVSDILVDVPSRVTPLIQQVHICLYHYLCAEVESRLFGSNDT